MKPTEDATDTTGPRECKASRNRSAADSSDSGSGYSSDSDPHSGTASTAFSEPSEDAKGISKHQADKNHSFHGECSYHPSKSPSSCSKRCQQY